MMELKDLGLAIAKARIAMNISQYELSLRLAKAGNYVHRVEMGCVNISVKALFEICRELDVNPEDLLKRE